MLCGRRECLGIQIEFATTKANGEQHKLGTISRADFESAPEARTAIDPGSVEPFSK